MLSEEQITQIEEELSGDERIETTYRRLRRNGYSRLEAVQALLDLLDLSLQDAKHRLLTSDTWDEARASTEGSEDPDGDEDKGPPLPPPAPA